MDAVSALVPHRPLCNCLWRPPRNAHDGGAQLHTMMWCEAVTWLEKSTFAALLLRATMGHHPLVHIVPEYRQPCEICKTFKSADV